MIVFFWCGVCRSIVRTHFIGRPAIRWWCWDQFCALLRIRRRILNREGENGRGSKIGVNRSNRGLRLMAQAFLLIIVGEFLFEQLEFLSCFVLFGWAYLQIGSPVIWIETPVANTIFFGFVPVRDECFRREQCLTCIALNAFSMGSNIQCRIHRSRTFAKTLVLNFDWV